MIEYSTVVWKDVSVKHFEEIASGAYIYKAINTQKLESKPTQFIRTSCGRICLAVHVVPCSQAVIGYQIDVDADEFELKLISCDMLLLGTLDLRPRTLKILYDDKYLRMLQCKNNYLFLSKV